ncbi:MAG: hypothetical protein ACE5OZ_12735 [Candidatus Heimdallarchaeota archaeon]
MTQRSGQYNKKVNFVCNHYYADDGAFEEKANSKYEMKTASTTKTVAEWAEYFKKISELRPVSKTSERTKIRTKALSDTIEFFQGLTTFLTELITSLRPLSINGEITVGMDKLKAVNYPPTLFK